MKSSSAASRSLKTPAFQASAARGHLVRSVNTGDLGPITTDDQDVDHILSCLSSLAAEKTPVLPASMEHDVRRLFQATEPAEGESSSGSSTRVTVPAPAFTEAARRHERITVPVTKRTAATAPPAADFDDIPDPGDRDTDEDMMTFGADMDEERGLGAEVASDGAKGSPYTDDDEPARTDDGAGLDAPSDGSADDDLRVCERMMSPPPPPPLPAELRPRKQQPPPLPRSPETRSSSASDPASPTVTAAPRPVPAESRAIVLYAIPEVRQSAGASRLDGAPDLQPATMIVRPGPPAPSKGRAWVPAAVGMAVGVACALVVATKAFDFKRALPASSAPVAMAVAPAAANEEPRPKALPAAAVQTAQVPERRPAPDTKPARQPAPKMTAPPVMAPAAVKGAEPVIATGPSLNGRLLGDEEE